MAYGFYITLLWFLITLSHVSGAATKLCKFYTSFGYCNTVACVHSKSPNKGSCFFCKEYEEEKEEAGEESRGLVASKEAVIQEDSPAIDDNGKWPIPEKQSG